MDFTSSRFAWLLRREWMQHHRGWLILAIAPAICAFVALPFAQVQIDDHPTNPAMVALMAGSIYLFVLLVLALMSALFQAPGLARRDQQDRSIEFWMSLPTTNVGSVGATVLMHLILMPLLVLLISAVFAQGFAALIVFKVLGAAALGEISLSAAAAFSAALVLRELVGLVFCVLWLSPVILLAMAASSFLKGWGVPALVAAIALIGGLLQQLTGHTQVWDVTRHWWEQAKVALIPLARGDIPFQSLFGDADAMVWLSNWLLRDIAQLLRDALSPSFAAALLIAAIGFTVVVWKRGRGT